MEKDFDDLINQMLADMHGSTIDDLIAESMRLYDEEIASRDDDDYEINPEQWKNLLDAYEFLHGIAETQNGKVDPLNLKPRQGFADIRYTGRIFDLSGEMEVIEFCRKFLNASAFGVDSLADGRICIEATFRNVFVRK